MSTYSYYPIIEPCVPFVDANILTDPDFSTGAAGALGAGVAFNDDGWSTGVNYPGRNVQNTESEGSTQDAPMSHFGGNITQIAFPGDAANGVPANNSLFWANGTNNAGAPWTMLEGTFAVMADSDYSFVYYSSSGLDPSFMPAGVAETTYHIEFNNTNISGSVTEISHAGTGTPDQWYRHEYTWNSGTATSLNIKFINDEDEFLGNDLCLTALDLHRFDDCGTTLLTAQISPASASVAAAETTTYSGSYNGGTGPYTIFWEESDDGGTTWAVIPGETGTTLDVTGA